MALLAAGALIDGLGVRFTLAIAASICGVCALVGVTALRGELGAPAAVDYAASGRSSDGVIVGVATSATAVDVEQRRRAPEQRSDRTAIRSAASSLRSRPRDSSLVGMTGR